MKMSAFLKKSPLLLLGLWILTACQPQQLLPANPLPSVKTQTAIVLPKGAIEQDVQKDGLNIAMVFVPGGDFLMGSPANDPNAGSDMKPQHKVILDAFWIDKTEVTNALYAKCVGDGVCRSPVNAGENSAQAYYGNPKYDNYPVQGIRWTDGQTFCKWAGARLPSEAEWEKAARGTDGRLYPWGNQPPDATRLNFDRNVGGPSAVGSYPAGASPYGALDMAGNLWEWVADWYSHDFYQRSPALNPLESEPQAYRACRGGSWNSSAERARADYRGNEDPGQCDSLTTVRCASSAK